MPLQSNPYFQAVKEHADNMLEHGRPLNSEHPSPLFSGTVDVARKEINTSTIMPPPGIRLSDFNWCGNNLMHDVPFLETLNVLTQLTGESKYSQAVDDVFEFYGKHCPHPETGLFPWGEHAQWSFHDRCALPCAFSNGLQHYLHDNYIIHDHLRFAPGWFWEKMWQHHPDAVVNFAHGLHWHIVNEETFEHNRHGTLTRSWWRDPKNPDDSPGKDFARYSGHFIFDALFACSKSDDTSLADWSRRKLQWHTNDPLPNGIIRGCARRPTFEQEGQHDGLALSVADAADLFDDDHPIGSEFAGYADELFAARINEVKQRPKPEISEQVDGEIWVNGYFRKPKKTVGLGRGSTNYQLLKRTGEEWYADAIIEHARWEAESLPPPPPGVTILPRTYEARLNNALTAHVVSNQGRFLKSADHFARHAVDALFRNGMFMGASNMKIFRATSASEYHVDEWAEPTTPGLYYSISGTPLLMRTLLRLALFQEGEEDLIGVDVHSR
jgi:hypothetical protein